MARIEINDPPPPRILSVACAVAGFVGPFLTDALLRLIPWPPLQGKPIAIIVGVQLVLGLLLGLWCASRGHTRRLRQGGMWYAAGSALALKFLLPHF